MGRASTFIFWSARYGCCYFRHMRGGHRLFLPDRARAAHRVCLPTFRRRSTTQTYLREAGSTHGWLAGAGDGLDLLRRGDLRQRRRAPGEARSR
jgi:hypothetical protein